MLRNSLCTLLVLFPFWANAQQQVRYEYWFDQDFSHRQHGEMPTQQQETFSFDASALGEGMHLINFRVQDNEGRWSSPYNRYFMHYHTWTSENNITSVEYWIDNDYAHRQTLKATDGELQLDIDAQRLVRGVHRLTLRTADKRGQFSSPTVHYFMSGMQAEVNNLITAYRYWFNDAAADATLVELDNPQSPFLLDVNLKPNHLIKEGELTDENTTTITDADGTERIAARNALHIMFCDTHGNWSQLVTEEFTALPAKDAEQNATLSNITLLAVDDEQAWRQTGANVGITLSGNYSHDNSQDGQLYYITDNGATRRAGTTLKAGEAQFEATIECVFKQDVTEHTLKLFAVDADEVPSDTVIVKIGEMGNTHLYDVQEVMTYTGYALEQDGITVYDYYGNLLSSDQCVLTYADNVNDGYASVWAEGRFPYYMGKSNSMYFKIHSVLNADEIAVLREFQQATQYDGWDLNRDGLYSDELKGITGYNTHIIGINLLGDNLEGELPASLLALPWMEEVQLSGNQLHGTLHHDQISSRMKSLLISYNRISHLTGPLPATIEDVRIDHQNLTTEPTAAYYNAMIDPDSFINTLPNIVLYDTQKRTFDRTMNIWLSDQEQDFICLNYDGGEISRNSNYSGSYYLNQNGSLVNAYDDQGNQYLVTFRFDAGDANIDSRVDVLDIQTTINYMCGYQSWFSYLPVFNFTAADTYADREVTREEAQGDEPSPAINIQDLVCTTNLLLASGEAEHRMPMQTPSTEPTASTDAYLYIEGDNVVLETYRPVAALQLTSTGNVQWLLGQHGLSQTTAHSGADVVAYSLSRNSLPIGRTVIGQCGAGCQLINACLADEEAQRISITIGQPSVNGIEDICHDAETMTYGADGVRRHSLQPGINIVRRKNGASIKSYIK